MTTTMPGNPQDENAPKASDLGEWTQCPWCTRTRKVNPEAVVAHGLPECLCGGEPKLMPKGWEPGSQP